jgi:copper chaperone
LFLRQRLVVAAIRADDAVSIGNQARRLTLENNITYRVPEMSTGHCEAAVTEEVSKVCGVAAIGIDLDLQLVHITGAGIDSDAVIAAIDEAGYEAVIA